MAKRYRLWFLAYLFSLFVLGCSDVTHQVPVGNVVLLKSKYLQDNEIHYGAFVVEKIEAPVKTERGTIVSFLTYRSVLDEVNSSGSKIQRISDTEPIKVGDDATGLQMHWDYASPVSIYLRPAIMDAELGTFICLTDDDKLPSKKLSSISCDYDLPS